MKRLNFTLDADTIQLLNELAATYYNGNKSQTVRAALESLATHVRHDGWIITGFTPVVIDDEAYCHTCHTHYEEGNVLLRPVFERGQGPNALSHLPSEVWLECSQCAEQNY
ncbi:MAG: hypothetical protein GVY18_01050 [Bacteroidetes bacterium]|jgi:hypothetical protein|nr:hypothetical protein [Bacteroidota bacterium]